jgi:putative peptidoglycan lipid II flippase
MAPRSTWSGMMDRLRGSPTDGAQQHEKEAADKSDQSTGLSTESPARPEIRSLSSRQLVAVLMSGALISKILGFIREILMAQVLGASMAADGFRGAITAVMLPLLFLQGESLPAIMIPMQRESRDNGDAPLQLTAMTIALTLVATAIMLVIEILGPWWVNAIVGGFVPETQALTLEFVRIMALAMPASAMLNCLAAGEIAVGRSRITNIRAAILNASVLLGIGLFVLTGWLRMLAWAFALAFNVLGVVSIWLFWRDGYLTVHGLRANTVIAAGMEFARRLKPLIALPIAEQANIWIERTLASRLVTGSVASLDYARTLTESALLLISQPVGYAVLSSYSRQAERVQIEAIARPILAFMMPASVFLFAFAPDVIGLVFHRGAFDEQGVLLTSQALRGMSVGLWAATLGWILLRILNSTYRNTMVAAILVVAYAANIAVNLVTTSIQQTTGAGTLILGLGEAARGCTMLGGVVLALQCSGRMLFLIGVASVPSAMLALTSWKIDVAVSSSYERLVAGGAACAFTIAVAALLLMPTERKAMFVRIRRWTGVKIRRLR